MNEHSGILNTELVKQEMNEESEILGLQSIEEKGAEMLPIDIFIKEEMEDEEERGDDADREVNEYSVDPDMNIVKEEMNEDLENFDMQHTDEEEEVQLPASVFIKEEIADEEGDENTDSEIGSSASDPAMTNKYELRTCIKFCVKLKKSQSETLQMVHEAFGTTSVSCSQCFKWYERFRMGRTSVEDYKRSGRPRTSKTPENYKKIQQIIREDRGLTTREICAKARINHTSCHAIISNDLNLHQISGKWVPRSLTFDEKQERVSICQDLQDVAKNDLTFLSRIISCGESWFYGLDFVVKEKLPQSDNLESPKPKKIRRVRFPTKNLLIVFFDVKGIVHWEFVRAETLGAELYCEVLSRLMEAVKQKRPALWHNQKWLLHHDSTPYHSAIRTAQFLAANSVPVVPHPACSFAPDLCPWEFALFPKLKNKMRVRKLDTLEEIRSVSEELLGRLRETDFHTAFKVLRSRWELCVKLQGDYCEGDGGQT